MAQLSSWIPKGYGTSTSPHFVWQLGEFTIVRDDAANDAHNSIKKRHHHDTQQIAVKKSKLEKDDQNKSIQINHQQFHEEITIISQVNHKNVKPLSIDYLHSFAQPPIIHRDIKSTDILFDENYTERVSDFGASVLIPPGHTGIATTVQGTLGYLDPEYLTTGTLTTKSDVYSFGVVLVELITGEKPISNCVRRSGVKSNIIQYFVPTIRENKGERYVEKIVDPNVVYDESHETEIETVAELAMKCLEGYGERRPTMKEVVEELVWLNKGNNKCYNNSQQNINEETDQLLVVDQGDQSSVSISNTNIKNHNQVVDYTTLDVLGYDGESSISLN
ncbi:hypothetical protein G4B88_031106 [Cannabis sativa]|uniref:Protein kinase domain-containing protein n=1 Tax=Cannabis sativa TaxID=3483 RepID=A0A7J6GT56_CANSA|nr:hypothetical protein G4B88_031106 [Cannabis sativa]